MPGSSKSRFFKTQPYLNKNALIIFAVVAFLFTAAYLPFCSLSNENADFVTYKVQLQQQEVKLYWKDDKGRLIRTLGNLNAWLDSKGQKLVFAMNAGMYKSDNSPLGLFIDRGITLAPLDTSAATGNFYLKPNGVFYITRDKKAFITTLKTWLITVLSYMPLSRGLCLSSVRSILPLSLVLLT